MDVDMKGYIKKFREKYQHEMPVRPENQPHKHTISSYVAKVQLTEPKDTSNPLGTQDIKKLQEIIGSLLFYVRGVYGTLMLTFNELASAQAQGTEDIKLALPKLLDYFATHDNAKIRYFASEMILNVHSDASYLSASRARSRVKGHFFPKNKIPEGQ